MMKASTQPQIRKPWYRFVKNRRFIQLSALILSNASILSVLRFLPCGYLQCSNCALSTFSCPLILIQRSAVMFSMGIFGMMSSKIIGSLATALAVLFFSGAAVGAWGCGWLCPFGFVQDMLHKIPLPKFKLPGWTGFMRVPFFVGLVALIPYLTRHLFFCDVCPAGTINRLWQQAAGIPLFFKAPEGLLAVVALVFLVVLLIAATVTHRPFCSLFCPIGGLNGLFNKMAGLYLKVDREHCRSCNLCQKKCPQGINPSLTPAHSQCIRCLECTRHCDALHLDIRL